jgi:oligopeptide/dipeptide ABC transporter ATP-binding protein
VLRVQNLCVRYPTEWGIFAPVDGISFDLERGEALALIGESGSGKTTAALALLRLLPKDAQLSGRVVLGGEDLLGLPEAELARIRGSGIAMVFQDPLAALNPLMRVGTQVIECLRAHGGLRGESARTAVVELLRTVGLPAGTADLYPHELSGGMRQRALAAIALACGPQVLVADEPTSALDPLAQADLLELLIRLRKERGIALLVATHDLAFAARLCDRISVLYAGRIVERGDALELLADPRHPYTAGLLRSLPPDLGAVGGARLEPIAGSPPQPWALPGGCRFRDRCPRARLDCAEEEPRLRDLGGREVACFHPLGAS